MKSMKGVIERLTELLDTNKTRGIKAAQRKHFEYLLCQANERQKKVQAHKRVRRHMAQASRRANRA